MDTSKVFAKTVQRFLKLIEKVVFGNDNNDLF